MGVFIIWMAIVAMFTGAGGNSKKNKKCKKAYRHARTRDNEWLDYSWYRDHYQK